MMALFSLGAGLLGNQAMAPAATPMVPTGGLMGAGGGVAGTALGQGDGVGRRLSQITGSNQASGGGFGSFFDNLNTNLESPAGQLGLGLLGRMSNSPALPIAGLLGMGLMGDQKVF